MTLSIEYGEQKAEMILNEVRGYDVQIPENLIDLGFRHMASLSAKVESYRSRVTTIMTEVLPLKSKAAQQLSSAKFSYENKLDVLIDTDPEIVALPSDKTKIARANKKLKVEREEVMEATAVHKQYVVLASIIQNTLDRLEKQSNAITEISNLAKRLAPPVQPYPGSPSIDPRMPAYPPKTYPGS